VEPSNRLPSLASLLFVMLFLNSQACNFISESSFPSMVSSPPGSPLPQRYTEWHCFAPWFTVFADKSEIKMFVSTEQMWNDHTYRQKLKKSLPVPLRAPQISRDRTRFFAVRCRRLSACRSVNNARAPAVRSSLTENTALVLGVVLGK
jgi:hypothetical protein